MHGINTSVPHFFSRIQGTHIVVTPEFVSKVLHVPRVAHPDYPSYEHLRTMSKDKLSSHFYKTPSSWGDLQNTPCLGFTKGPRFLNMVMTLVLHPLSHYNSITKPRAQFLLSFLVDISIDFPSHFILSLIDICRDMATRNKLIFPLAITRILCHFFVPFPVSPYFSMMCAIDAATIRWSKAQLRPRWPQTQMSAPPTSLAPSTSTPSSSAGGVTFDAIIAQLQRMDACLNTLSDELCQVNTRVGGIA